MRLYRLVLLLLGLSCRMLLLSGHVVVVVIIVVILEEVIEGVE